MYASDSEPSWFRSAVEVTSMFESLYGPTLPARPMSVPKNASVIVFVPAVSVEIAPREATSVPSGAVSWP